MISGLDHVVILTADLTAATQAYGALLGRLPAWQSRDDGVAAAVFTLDNMSVELLAAEGGGVAAERVRSAHATQGGDGIASLCFRVDDVAQMHPRLTRLALQPDPIAEGGSVDMQSSATLRWRRTRAATAACHGVRLFFLQMDGERPRSAAATPAPVLALDHVVIASQHPERAAALYGARLGLDMALDRSHPEWGRLLFFRCGDTIVEVVQRPGRSDQPDDRLWGLSWRVADLDAARQRLVAAGFDVSAVRDGRKPGTRVMSVRSAVCGVSTLILERETDRRAGALQQNRLT